MNGDSSERIAELINDDIARLEQVQASLLKNSRISLALFTLVATIGFVSAAMAIAEMKMNHSCSQDCGSSDGEIWRGECYCIESGEPVRSDK